MRNLRFKGALQIFQSFVLVNVNPDSVNLTYL